MSESVPTLNRLYEGEGDEEETRSLGHYKLATAEERALRDALLATDVARPDPSDLFSESELRVMANADGIARQRTPRSKDDGAPCFGTGDPLALPARERLGKALLLNPLVNPAARRLNKTDHAVLTAAEAHVGPQGLALFSLARIGRITSHTWMTVRDAVRRLVQAGLLIEIRRAASTHPGHYRLAWHGTAIPLENVPKAAADLSDAFPDAVGGVRESANGVNQRDLDMIGSGAMWAPGPWPDSVADTSASGDAEAKEALKRDREELGVRAKPKRRGYPTRAEMTEVHPRSNRSLLERILAKCTRDPKSGCLNWSGAFQKYGPKDARKSQAVVRFGSRTLIVHLALRIAQGGEPEGRYELTCGNEECVAPEHRRVAYALPSDD